MAQPSIEDLLLKPVPLEILTALLPDKKFIKVRRINDTGELKGKIEMWAYDFLLARLQADGVWESAPIEKDTHWRLLTRTADGSFLLVQTLPHGDANG